MDQRYLVPWLSKLLCSLRIPFPILSMLRKMFISITHFTPFRSLFTTIHTTYPSASQIVPAPKKKALLIGVCGTRLAPKTRAVEDHEGSDILKGPHTDVNAMRALLIEVYGYAPTDITLLLDDLDLEHVQPTIINILKAMDDLVRDARPGDRFFFHFAGHAGQDKTDDPGEEDGMDEYIVVSDGKILDNVLCERLVAPLPPGSTLTAIMDSCHSCSLLDLKHHRCNRVYVPWISKGKRRTKTRFYETVRKDAMWPSSMQLRELTRNLSADDVHLPSMQSVFESSTLPTTPAPRKTLKILTTNIDDAAPVFMASPVQEYASPKDLFCDGFKCHQSSSMDERQRHADIVCLSSSEDSQKTWEDAKGASMSQILIELLRKEPHPILYNMMQHIKYDFPCSHV
ncbi:caspase domain-containing protein [Pholiota molesta]|nr:caspase domain-containing protein [Pholiota molesta]